MLQWEAGMQIGIAKVDAQHRELVRQVNDLMGAMRQGKGREVIGDVLTFLGKYAVEHFRDEEALMRQHGYPEYEAHKALHEKFKQDFGALAKQFDESTTKLALTVDVQHRITDWLRNHILETDAKFGQYVRAQKAA